MTASRRPLRVGIIGCHRMLDRVPQSHNWAAAFDAVPDTEIAGIFDYGAQTRAAFKSAWGSDIPDFDDLRQMLEVVQPDIVCIATRQTMHADQAEQAVAAGVKGIFFEKPLATTMDEVDRIVTACRNIGVVFGLDRAWWPPYVHLAKLLRDGLIGEIQGVFGYGLAQLLNHGNHWLDVMLTLAGNPEPEWASGYVYNITGSPTEDRDRLDPPGRGEFGWGDINLAIVMREGAPSHTYELYGTEGRLLVTNDATEAEVWNVQEGSGYLGREGLVADQIKLPDRGAPGAAGQQAVQDLVAHIETGQISRCGLDRARLVTELGFAFHESHLNGGARVSLPLQERNVRVPSYEWGNEPPFST
jgi:predicted dehydrogenase